MPTVNGSVLVYGPDGTQGTITDGSIKLFDVAYGTLTSSDAVGAYLSATSYQTDNTNATALTLSAIAHSTGIAAPL